MQNHIGIKDASIRLGVCHIHDMLDVSPAVLRTYELEGLVSPSYERGQRFFTVEQLTWISCIEHMIKDLGISIPGLTRLLELCPCWDVTDCPADTRERCKAKQISLGLLKGPMEKGIQTYPTDHMGSDLHQTFTCGTLPH